ncbi:MAG TPA: hypothetical protein VJ302_05780 [Blastocatellia bacterium]|nr:hypothetical protein [Blastocatellia bacterium]
MLVVECKTLKCNLDVASRIYILDRLQAQGLAPLVRSARMKAYELALQGSERVKGFEQLIAGMTETEGRGPYLAGDIFCIGNHVLFLVFDEEEAGVAGIRAGIIARENTTEPMIELDGFCRKVSEALNESPSVNHSGRGTPAPDYFQWQRRVPRIPVEFERAVSRWGQVSRWGKTVAERQGILELIGDPDVRKFLKRVKDAQANEVVVEALALGMNRSLVNALTEKLVGKGLLRREILIRCNWRGQKLFRLSSAEALALIAESRAKCEFCGGAISDERIEDLVTLAGPVSELLSDGSWLIHTLNTILSRCGITEKQIAVGSIASEEVQVMVCACGESFLFILRDADLSVLDARRMVEKLDETEASQLVVMATGQVDDGARLYLSDQARHRKRSRRNREVILIEGLNTAMIELQRAFNMAALRQELSKLDIGLGLPIWTLVSASFDLEEPMVPKQVAAAAACGSDLAF